MAEVVITENETYIGTEVANSAIEEIHNSEKGGKVTNEKEKRTTRKRSVSK